MTARRGLLGMVAASLLYVSLGCGGGAAEKMKYAAPPSSMMPLAPLSIQFNLAHSAEHKFWVKMYFTNLSNQVMIVNRDGMGLRLPDGRVLERRGYHGEPYMLQPGQGHKVWVEFIDKTIDMRTITQAQVIIGGISFQTDPVPRVVGELCVSLAGPLED